jgi:putative flavoprotein involved in K+ transport
MLDTTSDIEITNVLGALDKALSSGDVAAAVNQFLDDCYWRDLVTFTWNIKTLEGKDAIRDMLNAQLASVAPLNWRIAEGESATEDGGIITAWITFETGVALGYGLVRVKNGKIWTLLTSMVELKGHEEPLGYERPQGAKHGAGKHRPTWKEDRQKEAEELGYKIQPLLSLLVVGRVV